MMELHTYTLADADALRRYTEVFWPRHIRSLRSHGIIVRGVWIDVDSPDHRVVALVDHRAGDDPARLAENYRRSVDFVEDQAEFDTALITSARTVTLAPVAGLRLAQQPTVAHPPPR